MAAESPILKIRIPTSQANIIDPGSEYIIGREKAWRQAISEEQPIRLSARGYQVISSLMIVSGFGWLLILIGHFFAKPKLVHTGMIIGIVFLVVTLLLIYCLAMLHATYLMERRTINDAEATKNRLNRFNNSEVLERWQTVFSDV